MDVLSRILDPGEALRYRCRTGSQSPLSSTVSRTHHRQVSRLARTSLAYGCGPAPEFDRTSPAGSGTAEAAKAKGSRAGPRPHFEPVGSVRPGSAGPLAQRSPTRKARRARPRPVGHNDPGSRTELDEEDMDEQTKLDTQMVAVTVFLDGARVVRRGRVTLDVGTRTVVLTGLPATVDHASVRVVARGRRSATGRRGPS